MVRGGRAEAPVPAATSALQQEGADYDEGFGRVDFLWYRNLVYRDSARTPSAGNSDVTSPTRGCQPKNAGMGFIFGG